MPQLAHITEQARGMDDAAAAAMTAQLVELRLAGNNGHTATFTYGLSETHGWDVRAELDHRVIATRHCSSWRGVEGLNRVASRIHTHRKVTKAT